MEGVSESIGIWEAVKMVKDPLTLGRATKTAYTALGILITACLLILWVREDLLGIVITVGIVLLPIIAIWVSVRWRRHHRSDKEQ